MDKAPQSIELPGLEVVLDSLEYRPDISNVPSETPHAFVYHLTIRNNSNRTIRLLGRKWVVEDADGNHRVIEGDRIVGQTPKLAPGEAFSYNSFHLTAGNARARGSFHGVDEFGNKIHVCTPVLEMIVPGLS
ncbi:MAG: ApaG domain [Verrucomicrobia bacterium]|nr:MAG: ApaG domain [Verrucomicrobiota bacterium]